jgi:hypothetical protein
MIAADPSAAHYLSRTMRQGTRRVRRPQPEKHKKFLSEKLATLRKGGDIPRIQGGAILRHPFRDESSWNGKLHSTLAIPLKPVTFGSPA